MPLPMPWDLPKEGVSPEEAPSVWARTRWVLQNQAPGAGELQDVGQIQQRQMAMAEAAKRRQIETIQNAIMDKATFTPVGAPPAEKGGYLPIPDWAWDSKIRERAPGGIGVPFGIDPGVLTPAELRYMLKGRLR